MKKEQLTLFNSYLEIFKILGLNKTSVAGADPVGSANFCHILLYFYRIQAQISLLVIHLLIIVLILRKKNGYTFYIKFITIFIVKKKKKLGHFKSKIRFWIY